MESRFPGEDGFGETYAQEQTARATREAEETSTAHTLRLSEAGIIDRLIDHNRRHKDKNIPQVEKASAAFGVILKEDALEIRGWWDNNEDPSMWINHRQNWVWTVGIADDATHTVGYDRNLEYALTTEQAMVLAELAVSLDETDDTQSIGLISIKSYQSLSRFPVPKNAVISVPLAPQETMSTKEVVQLYFPGEQEQSLAAISATSHWLHHVLSECPIYDDQLDRVMALLLKAKSVLRGSPPALDLEITEALGVYLSRHRGYIAAAAFKSYNSEQFMGVEDLISQGQIGMISALERFDLGIPNLFRTYAISRIRGSMIDHIRDVGATIRPPRAVISLKKRFEAKDPTLTEAELRQVEELSLMQAASLDGVFEIRHANSEEGVSLMEMIPDPYDEDAEEGDAAIEIDVEKLLGTMPRRYQNVVRMYLGISPYTDSYNLREISTQLDVTESRASQMLTRALNHLRAVIEKDQA